MNRNIVLLVLVANLLDSCQSVNNEADDSAIVVEFKKEEIAASDLVNDYTIIIPSSPNDDALVYNYDKVLLSEKRCYILDQRGNRLVAFDMNGGFVASTANMIGNGPNEYIRLTDATIDNNRGLIYLYCDAPYSLIVLDYDLSFIKKVDLGNLLLFEIASDENFIYGISRDEKNPLLQKLVAIDKNTYSVSESILEYDKGVESVFGGKALMPTKNGVFLCFTFDDVIYKISDKKVVNKYLLDLGDKGTKFPNISTSNAKAFYDDNINSHYSLQNFTTSDSLLIFGSNKIATFVLDMNSKECVCYERSLYSDILPFHSQRIIPSEGRSEVIIWKTMNDAILNCLKYWEEEDMWHRYDEHTINHLKGLSEDDNPVLVIWNFK